jgi:hypothetical protein
MCNKENQPACSNLTETNALAYCVRALKIDYSCKYEGRPKDNLPETNTLTYLASLCVTKKTYQLAAILMETNALAYCVRALSMIQNDYSCKYDDMPKDNLPETKTLTYFTSPCVTKKTNQLVAILIEMNALAYCVRALKNYYSCKYEDKPKHNLPETNTLTYLASLCVTKKTYQLAAILMETNALAYCIRELTLTGKVL